MIYEKKTKTKFLLPHSSMIFFLQTNTTDKKKSKRFIKIPNLIQLFYYLRPL